VNIPDYAFNEGTLAYYREIAEFDKTITGRERIALYNDPLAHHYIGRVAVIKKAYPEKSVDECRAFYDDERNWVGPKTGLSEYICNPRNEEFAKHFFKEFDKEDFVYDKIPEPRLFEFLERERGFRWVRFGNVWNGVYSYVNEGQPKKAYIVELPYQGTMTLHICDVDYKSAYAQLRELVAKGEFDDAILKDERNYDISSGVMRIE
jgi:hypothetical protein